MEEKSRLNMSDAEGPGFVFLSYIGDLVSGHICVLARCFQVIVRFILSSFGLINISADLRHIDSFCPVSVNRKQEEQLKNIKASQLCCGEFGCI